MKLKSGLHCTLIVEPLRRNDLHTRPLEAPATNVKFQLCHSYGRLLFTVELGAYEV